MFGTSPDARASHGAFVDREDELEWLEEGWASGHAEFRILYGRRRVGKSRLLDRFGDGKPTIVYQAVEGSTPDQLRDLTAAILRHVDDPVLQAAPLATWGQALAVIGNLARAGRLLFIFDEYQYAAEADPTLASQLQRWWSREADDLPIYLVLCGSYVRFFVDNVLTGPAYGRNTGSLQLQPLGYRQAGRFLDSWSAEDRLRAFALTGGVPHYIQQLDRSRTLAWNIAHNVLRRGSVLYQEAELLVREELREPRTYYSILRAIADGCTRAGEIGNRIGAHSDITPYLRTLEALGLTEYQAPLIGKGRRGVWRLSDPYVRFWFRFVLPSKPQIEHGASPERMYDEVVAPYLDHFVSRPTFEEVARAWLIDQANRGRIGPLSLVGPWWGPVPSPTPDNPLKQAEAEIEVVALRGSSVAVVGEAKWTREPVGFPVLNHLREVAARVPGFSPESRLYLFGREFDPRLTTAARAEGVTLVSVDDLYAEVGSAEQGPAQTSI